MAEPHAKCSGDCDCGTTIEGAGSVAGTVQVAGRSPLRFISRDGGDVELVECVCGQRGDAEERGVAGLLRGDKLSAGAPQAEADDADKKPDATKVVGEQDPWLVAKELLLLGAGMFLSRVSWVVIKVSGGNEGKVWEVCVDTYK